MDKQPLLKYTRARQEHLSLNAALVNLLPASGLYGCKNRTQLEGSLKAGIFKAIFFTDRQFSEN